MIGDYKIGIDRIKITEEVDDTPEAVRARFIQRMQEIGAIDMEQSAKHIKVRLYSPRGSTDFLTLVARNRFVEVYGSVASFLYGGGELLRYDDLPEALQVVGNILESNLRLARVDSIEITADAHLPQPYEAYTPCIQAPPRMERTERKGTIYIEGVGRTRAKGKTKPPSKRLKIYDKGKELGKPPEIGCLLRVELTIDRGASTIGRAIGVGGRLMATDLTDSTIWNSTINQLVQSFSNTIQGSHDTTDEDMKPTDRILIALAKEVSKQGVRWEELPSVKHVMNELDKKTRYRVRQKIRKVSREILANQGGYERANELREFIETAGATQATHETKML